MGHHHRATVEAEARPISRFGYLHLQTEVAAVRFPLPDDVLTLRVSLVGIEPQIWRRLLVSRTVRLPQLHLILQPTMGWTNSHLHQFKVGDLRFAEPDDDYEPGPIDYRHITLDQIAHHSGATCVYEYDFGDSWEHLIEIEDELPADGVKGPLPQCLGGEGACPPEDCGGPDGYAQLLEAFGDPRHPEHESYREWAGHDFDPAAFDLDRVNRLLARLALRPAPRERVPRRRSR